MTFPTPRPKARPGHLRWHQAPSNDPQALPRLHLGEPGDRAGECRAAQGYQQGGCMSWQAYEAAKRAWIAAHPGATPEQYDAAMRAIAERLGI